MEFVSLCLETLKSLLSGHAVAELFCLFIHFFFVSSTLLSRALSKCSDFDRSLSCSYFKKWWQCHRSLNIADPDSAHKLEISTVFIIMQAWSYQKINVKEKVWAFLSHARYQSNCEENPPVNSLTLPQNNVWPNWSQI